nr:MAG TPA: hypothetical protein [Caudoviricetes sp.]
MILMIIFFLLNLKLVFCVRKMFYATYLKSLTIYNFETV